VKRGDALLQSWRIRKAAPYIPSGATVLDVGCSDGALFRILKDRISSGIGIDPTAVPPDHGSFRFIRGAAPASLPEGITFDAITLLAVLEHIPTDPQRELASACAALLRTDGHVICTVPSPRVDHIIDVGRRLHVLDGMTAHEHYGFQPSDTVRLFTDSGLALRRLERFQLGLNHLYVFAKLRPPAASPPSPRADRG